MGYVINYDKQENTVYTIAEGKLNTVIASEFSRNAYHEGETHHCMKYLFDLRDTVVIDSIVNIVQFAWDLEELGLKTEYYVAVVARNSEKEHRLFNVISKNRGYSRLQYFSNYNAAQKWLNQC